VNALREMFMDDDGCISSMRVLATLTTCTVLGMWCYSIFRAGDWIPLDLETVVALVTAQGAKVLQRQVERRS